MTAYDNAVLVEVADAITYELNNNDFGETFTAERSYADWNEKLTELDTLRVDVVPAKFDIALGARGLVKFPCEVDIGVRKRVDAQNSSTGRIDIPSVDALVLLFEKIVLFFVPSQDTQQSPRLSTFTDATWKSTEIRTAYTRETIKEHRQYLGITRVTYEVSTKP